MLVFLLKCVGDLQCNSEMPRKGSNSFRPRRSIFMEERFKDEVSKEAQSTKYVFTEKLGATPKSKMDKRIARRARWNLGQGSVLEELTAESIKSDVQSIFDSISISILLRAG